LSRGINQEFRIEIEALIKFGFLVRKPDAERSAVDVAVTGIWEKVCIPTRRIRSREVMSAASAHSWEGNHLRHSSLALCPVSKSARYFRIAETTNPPKLGANPGDYAELIHNGGMARRAGSRDRV
jgi:hypothetical protein